MNVRTHTTLEEFPTAEELRVATLSTWPQLRPRCVFMNEAICREVRAATWTYLDDESPSSERRWIRAHLAHCDQCRAYLQFQRAFLRTLRAGLSVRRADDALRDRIRDALAAASLALEASTGEHQEPSA